MIKPKEEEKQEKTIDNELDWRKYLIDVQSKSIKNEINSDLTLANLNEQDKEGIIEMTTNAFFCMRQLELVKGSAEIWEWQKNKWEKRNLNKEELQKIDIYKRDTFNSFMIRVQMTLNSNRNKLGNYLINILMHKEEELEKQEEIPQGFLNKLKEKLKPEEK